MQRVQRAAIGIIATAALGAAWAAHSQDAKPLHVFTAAQSDHGSDLYKANCAQCHGENLNDGGFAPPLKGERFKKQWNGKSEGDLYSFINTNMPPGQQGVLSADDYAALEAFILHENGDAAGDKPLAADAGALTGRLW
jgi:mono/diheme cytochrome c family protein